MKDKWEGYIPTPKRIKLGLPVERQHFGDYRDRIDSSDGKAFCWPWTGPVDRHGYGVISKRLGRAHRVVWSEFHGQHLTPDQVVRHTCDNPRCCNPAHLELGTQLDNVKDRVERGRSARGAMNGRNKLDVATVLDIFTSRKKVTHLAKQYGLHESTVRGIKTGKTWGWATGSNSNKPVGAPNLTKATSNAT